MTERATRAKDERGSDQVPLDELVAGLTHPEAYDVGLHVESVDVVETHISLLFFAGDRVYKLKKGVALEFLDYSTVEQRRRFCEEELRLNRRISPRMYLDVLPVTVDGGSYFVGGEERVVDWVVEMRRLPERGMLPNLLDRGAIGAEDLRRIVVTLAGFHSRAMTGPRVNRHGLPEVVSELVRENIDQLDAVDVEGLLPAGARAFLEERFARELGELRGLFGQRVANWYIREGHGDLHAGNVCLVDEEVFVYDCVEFDFSLRCGDYASDVAFLVMDLVHRGHPRFARELVRTYAEVSSDADLERMVDFYLPHRALIRAKVEALRAVQLDERADADAARRTARSYVHLALASRFPGVLVAVSGEPRRTAPTASHLLDRFGWSAAAHGDGRSTAPDPKRAAALLAAGATVLCDAGSDADALAALEDVAARLGCPRFLLSVEPPESTGARAGGPERGSWRVVSVDPDASEVDHAHALFEVLILAADG